jgi:hypothetical protein
MEEIFKSYFSKNQILNIKLTPGMLHLYENDLRLASLHHKKHYNGSYEFHTTVLDNPGDTHRLIFMFVELIPKDSSILTQALKPNVDYILLQLGFKRTEAFAKYMKTVDFKIPYDVAVVKFTGGFTHSFVKK